MIIGKYVPPAAGLKPPSLWGTRARLEELFGSKGKVQTTSRHFSFPLPFAAALHRGVQHLVRPDEQDLRGAGRRPRAASGLRARSARADRARQSFRGWNDGGAERVPRGGDREEPRTALRLDQRVASLASDDRQPALLSSAERPQKRWDGFGGFRRCSSSGRFSHSSWVEHRAELVKGHQRSSADQLVPKRAVRFCRYAGDRAPAPRFGQALPLQVLVDQPDDRASVAVHVCPPDFSVLRREGLGGTSIHLDTAAALAREQLRRAAPLEVVKTAAPA